MALAQKELSRVNKKTTDSLKSDTDVWLKGRCHYVELMDQVASDEWNLWKLPDLHVSWADAPSAYTWAIRRHDVCLNIGKPYWQLWG